ncbi:polysaccharide deacetylase family protein [Candidatus Micrarchaeota archaeon]|nr:polysaccharide deacetylase family protein [Candidatus Micrarchaeota archaeon]
MTFLVFTVDVDRDAAWPQNGSGAAGTRNRSAPSFESSRKGFFSLLETVNDLGIPTTFFFEAATALELEPVSLTGHEVACHGLDHEDFTGKHTEKPFTRVERRTTLQNAVTLLENRFKVEIDGFRAPYLGWDLDLLMAIAETGFSYDSSVVAGHLKNPPLPELYLPEWKDAAGQKMSGYLWPLMEGKRAVSEYVDAVSKSVVAGEPYIVLATHSWHTHCSVERGELPEAEARFNVQRVRQLLEAVKGIPNLEFKLARDVVLQKL